LFERKKTFLFFNLGITCLFAHHHQNAKHITNRIRNPQQQTTNKTEKVLRNIYIQAFHMLKQEGHVAAAPSAKSISKK
jgi:hypothetical protein